MPAARTAVLQTIPFECPACLRHLRVAAQFAVRLVRCPVCRAMVNVPGTAAEVMVSPDDPTEPLRPKTKPMKE